MKKCLLALILCLVTLPALATDKYLFHPTINRKIVIRTPLVNISYKVIQITIENLRNFNRNKFSIHFNSDGTEIKIVGKSRKRTKSFYTYRKIFSETIQLPAPIPVDLWNTIKSYKYHPEYFSNYNHKVDDTLIITIPVAEYISDVEVDENGQ